jgi:hypothetical protein
MGKLYTKKVDAESVEEKPIIEEQVKKPVDEKKLASLEKARQRRLEKKLEKEALQKAESEKMELEKQEAAKLLEAKQAKKMAAAEKRKQKKLMLTPEPSLASSETTTVNETVEEQKQPKPKRKREPKERVEKKLKTDPIEPPKWFTTFLEGVKKEQVQQSGEKITKAEMKAEVQAVAEKKCNDGYTRDMIQNQQDKHLTKMYSMMFNGRRL